MSYLSVNLSWQPRHRTIAGGARESLARLRARRQRGDLPAALNGSRDRRALLQRQMGPRVIVVGSARSARVDRYAGTRRGRAVRRRPRCDLRSSAPDPLGVSGAPIAGFSTPIFRLQQSGRIDNDSEGLRGLVPSTGAMKRRFTVGILAASLLAMAPGCAYPRRIGKCTYAGAAIGAVVLGGVGAGIGAESKGPHGAGRIGSGLGAGLAAGALIGGLVGHFACDPPASPPPGSVAAGSGRAPAARPFVTSFPDHRIERVPPHLAALVIPPATLLTSCRISLHYDLTEPFLRWGC